jgi:hypothetical protein
MTKTGYNDILVSQQITNISLPYSITSLDKSLTSTLYQINSLSTTTTNIAVKIISIE